MICQLCNGSGTVTIRSLSRWTAANDDPCARKVVCEACCGTGKYVRDTQRDMPAPQLGPELAATAAWLSEAKAAGVSTADALRGMRRQRRSSVNHSRVTGALSCGCAECIERAAR